MQSYLSKLRASLIVAIRFPKALFIGIFLFFLTTYGDSIAFSLADDYMSNPLYYVTKFLVLVFFIVLSQLIPRTYYKFKNGDSSTRLYVKYFGIYALIMTLLWLLVYPGNYTGVDEAYVLGGARTLNIYFSWHHVLMVVWYAFGLGIFPSLATIAFVQLMAISAIVAYIMTEFHKLIGTRAQYLFYVFLLPSVLIFNIVPLRLSIYAFLEMLLFFIIIKKIFQQGSLYSACDSRDWDTNRTHYLIKNRGNRLHCVGANRTGSVVL